MCVCVCVYVCVCLCVMWRAVDFILLGSLGGFTFLSICRWFGYYTTLP